MESAHVHQERQFIMEHSEVLLMLFWILLEHTGRLLLNLMGQLLAKMTYLEETQ
jgi:hypothetical protein